MALPRAVGAVIASVLLLAACGDDDDQPLPNGTSETSVEDRGEPPEEEKTPQPPMSLQVRAGAVEGPIFVRAFMPADITIRVGDSLTWLAGGGEHTVSFLGEADPFPLIVPDPASPSDVLFNPRVVNPQPNPLPTSYDGSSSYNSGFFSDASGVPPTLTFTAAGSFPYRCLIHPPMSGTVEVVDDLGAEVATQLELDEQATQLQQDYIAEAEQALTDARDEGPESAEGPNEVTIWEVIAGFSTDHADIRAFVPEELEIAPGDSVIWVNEAAEPHSITFGDAIVLQVEDTAPDGSMRLVLNPDVLNVTLGGFEFIEGELFHSGLLLTNGPLGVRFQLLFADPGLFSYIDSLYPDLMSGTIVVR